MGNDGIYGGKAKSKRCVFRYFLKVATEMAEGTFWGEGTKLHKKGLVVFGETSEVSIVMPFISCIDIIHTNSLLCILANSLVTPTSVWPLPYKLTKHWPPHLVNIVSVLQSVCSWHNTIFTSVCECIVSNCAMFESGIEYRSCTCNKPDQSIINLPLNFPVAVCKDGNLCTPLSYLA